LATGDQVIAFFLPEAPQELFSVMDDALKVSKKLLNKWIQ